MNLQELQQAMADNIRAPDAPTKLDITGGKQQAEQRLQIYRNHYVISLTEAVSATYPATRTQLGCDLFQTLARRYVLDHPPVSGCLADYGETFVQWLRSTTSADPNTGDIAALEWALERTAMVRTPQAFPFNALAELTPEQYETVLFQLAPGVTLFSASWDVVTAYDRLITADHCAADNVSPAESDSSLSWLLYRKAEGVGVLPADAHLQTIVELCRNDSPLSALEDELTQAHLDALFTLVQKGLIESFSQGQES